MPYPLHLNISDDLEKDLRVFADEHELSISAAVRLAILQMVRPGGRLSASSRHEAKKNEEDKP